MFRANGEIVLTFIDGALTVDFPEVGNITPAVLEKNWPLILRALAMHRIAERAKQVVTQEQADAPRE